MNKFKVGDLVQVFDTKCVVTEVIHQRQDLREIGSREIITYDTYTYTVYILKGTSNQFVQIHEGSMKMIQPFNYKLKSLFKNKKDNIIWMLNKITKYPTMKLYFINKNKTQVIIPCYKLYQIFDYLYGIDDKVIQINNLIDNESKECIIKDIKIIYDEFEIYHQHLKGYSTISRSDVDDFVLLSKVNNKEDFKNLKGMKRAIAKLKAKGYCLEYMEELERKYA